MVMGNKESKEKNTQAIHSIICYGDVAICHNPWKIPLYICKKMRVKKTHYVSAFLKEKVLFP